MPTLSGAENLSWDTAASRSPALDALDFTTYPAFHRALREAFRTILRPFHPVADLGESGVLARRIADETFEDESLRTALRESLAHVFTDPRAVRAYHGSPAFEQAAQSLVLDRLERRALLPFPLPWSSERLREAARQWAAQRAGELQTPQPRLSALETLLIDPAGQGEWSKLVVARRRADWVEQQVLGTIQPTLRSRGFEPLRAAPAAPYLPAASLHEAIANLLAAHGVTTEVRTDQATEFVVTPETGSARRRARIHPEIADMMSALCRRLSELGYPSTWRFGPGPD